MAKAATLKAKIGQMLIIGFKGMALHPNDPIVKAILARHVGGVILFDYDYPSKTYEHNIQTPKQLSQLTQQLQKYNQQAANNEGDTGYPLFISIDYEGGKVNRLKESYGFPQTRSAAELALCPPEEVEHYAQSMAKTLQACGININFAPVLDVNVNPESPAIGKLGRSFSSDPQKVALYAGIVAKAHHEHGVISAYKHFPGHGSAKGDTHLGFVDVTETWQDYELYPFKTLLQEPYCSVVMTAHVLHKGLDSQGFPASLSAAITKDLLRTQLNYKGVVVTDDLQMKAITDQYGLPKALTLAVNAGADILVFGNQLSATWQDPDELIELIVAAVKSGEISESRIDEAYGRIIALKEQLIRE